MTSLRSTPQQLVEHALASSTADDCITIVRDVTSANLRWANNTLTTNGVMTEMSVTVVSFAAVQGGVATGSVSGSASTPEQVTALVQAADAAARAGSPAEDAPSWSPAHLAGLGHRAGDHRHRRLRRVRTGPRRGVRPGRRRGPPALRLREPRRRHHLSRVHPRPPAAARAADRALRLHRQGHLAHPQRLDRRRDPRLPRRRRRARWPPTVAQRLAWAERRIDLPAGRYDTILPPSSVADLMIDAYWGAGARVAHEGESVYSRRGGGTRIGDKVAAPGVSLFSDPAYPGLECAPFAIAGASDNTDSVFDNGLPLERTDWIRDGLLDRRCSRPATPPG